MENTVQAELDSIMGEPDVTGAAISDRSGLCLLAKGNVTGKDAAYMVSMLRRAQALNHSSPPPTVSLEADDRTLVAREVDGFVLVVSRA